jgi:hypothetical protein
MIPMTPTLRLLALTPRSATALLAPATHRYRLSAPVAWRLDAPGRPGFREGRAGIVPLFLDGLAPATDYRLVTDLGEAAFRTPPCAGLVDVTHHGAVPGGADATAAFARAIAAVPRGGTLLVPPGRYVTGPILLRSDMVLHLAEGAEIAARADRRTGRSCRPATTKGASSAPGKDCPRRRTPRS